MKDVSVEYAHIYTNDKIGEEHKLSLDILGELKEKFSKENIEASLVILIDDYSFPDPSFNYTEFSDWLVEHGHSPDLIMRESQLIPLCDDVVAMIDDNVLKQELTDYVKRKKYPCSLFVAAWYLLRLGVLTHDSFPNHLYAKRLLNILPESFRPYEDRAMDILFKSKHKDIIDRVEHHYFKGREIK